MDVRRKVETLHAYQWDGSYKSYLFILEKFKHLDIAVIITTGENTENSEINYWEIYNKSAAPMTSDIIPVEPTDWIVWDSGDEEFYVYTNEGFHDVFEEIDWME